MRKVSDAEDGYVTTIEKFVEEPDLAEVIIRTRRGGNRNNELEPDVQEEL